MNPVGTVSFLLMLTLYPRVPVLYLAYKLSVLLYLSVLVFSHSAAVPS